MPSEDERPENMPLVLALIHVVSLVVWICIVMYTYQTHPHLVFVLLGVAWILPIVLLIAGAFKITPEDEVEMMNSGVLSISVIIIITLVSSMSNNFQGDHKTMAVLVFLTLIFVLFTVPDFYFGHRWMPVTRNVRIVFQLLSVSTASLAVGMFFVNRRSIGWTRTHETMPSVAAANVVSTELSAESGAEKH